MFHAGSVPGKCPLLIKPAFLCLEALLLYELYSILIAKNVPIISGNFFLRDKRDYCRK